MQWAYITAVPISRTVTMNGNYAQYPDFIPASDSWFVLLVKLIPFYTTFAIICASCTAGWLGKSMIIPLSWGLVACPHWHYRELSGQSWPVTAGLIDLAGIATLSVYLLSQFHVARWKELMHHQLWLKITWPCSNATCSMKMWGVITSG